MVHPPLGWRVKGYRALMLIGEVAERAGVSVKTVRYYEEVGVIESAARTPGGYRDYDEGVLERLRFVRSAQAVGLTLGEIREVVAFRERGESPCTHVLGLLETHAAEVDRRIRELRNLRRELVTLAQRAKALDPDKCPSSIVCHIVTSP